jgi:hypothetical protein
MGAAARDLTGAAADRVGAMSYEALWIVTFTPDWNETRRVRAAGPFPAVDAAEEFARALRDEWPADNDPEIEVVQLEATEPISELIAGDR